MSAPHSKCIQLQVGSISDAVGIFSRKSSNGEVPLVLVPGPRNPFSGSGWWLTVPTGCSCLMQKFGKDIGVGQPGGKVMPPYYRIAYMVTGQSCNYNAPVKQCPTQDNVRVGVDVSIVFNIRSAKDFVYKLGVTNFDQLLSGAVDEGIRVLVRAQTHQTVRSLRGARAEQLLNLLNQKFDACGVSFSTCAITAVDLPQALEESLEATTTIRKEMIKTKRGHEFNMGEIQRTSDMTLEELNRKNEQTIVMENGKKKRAELEHEQRLVKANENYSTMMIETGQQAQVRKMETEAMLARAKVEMERARVEIISKAEADAEARRVQADIDFEKAQMIATAEKAKLVGEAEAIRLDAQAEAKSTQHLTHKRKHELEMREKDVIMKLAEKAQYNLIGDTGDKLVDAVMTGHIATEGARSSSGWFK